MELAIIMYLCENHVHARFIRHLLLSLSLFSRRRNLIQI